MGETFWQRNADRLVGGVPLGVFAGWCFVSGHVAWFLVALVWFTLGGVSFSFYAYYHDSDEATR